MIKVESDMLVLDSSFTKEDVKAIDYFVQIAVQKERERIIKLIEPLGCEENGVSHDCSNGLGYTTAADIIALIKGENK